MMKNKKFTYVLGCLVLLVWGIIVYRIFSSMGGDEEDQIPVAVKVSKEPYKDYTVNKDTTRLLLNYKDPFEIIKQLDTVIKAESHKLLTTKSIPVTTKPAFNWGFIKYSGYVRNPGSKKLIAILNINGKVLMMTEGETADQVKLVKNLQDSIKVNFNGKTTFIKIQSGAL